MTADVSRQPFLYISLFYQKCRTRSCFDVFSPLQLSKERRSKALNRRLHGQFYVLSSEQCLQLATLKHAARTTSKHPDDPATLDMMHEAATALQAANSPNGAKELFNLTWQRQKAVLGPMDPATLSSLYCGGFNEISLGQYAEAEKTYTPPRKIPQKSTLASSATWDIS